MPEFGVITSAVSAAVGSLVTFLGVLISGYRAKKDSDIGVSTEERERRRDTVADRDALIDQIQEEQRELRSRMTVVECELQIEREWNRALIDHIYRQLPPPPPPRPTRN